MQQPPARWCDRIVRRGARRGSRKRARCPLAAQAPSSRSMKDSRSASSRAEVGSSAITSAGAEQRARRRDALLLADRQCSRAPIPQLAPKTRALEQPTGLFPRRRRAPHARRKTAGQQHVVEHREVGQQVELLEDVADVVGPDVIARDGGQRRPVPSQQSYGTRARQEDPGHQRQQRALAAAAGAAQEQPLAGRRSSASMRTQSSAAPGQPKRTPRTLSNGASELATQSRSLHGLSPV